MVLTNLFNEEALIKMINDEVEKLTKIKFEEFKQDYFKELAQNYFLEDSLISRQETARMLSMCVRNLDYNTSEGKIKSVNQGRSVKYRKSDILEYIRNLK